MIRYHQPLLKPLNKLKIFREEIYQESISDERLTTRQETKTLYTFFSKKRLLENENGCDIAYYICHHTS